MTPVSNRALCSAPETIYVLSKDGTEASPFATAKVNRTYPVLKYAAFRDKHIVVLDPLAFPSAPRERVLFVYSDRFHPYAGRQTSIESLRAIAVEETNRYRGAA